jgi:aryl-alcohol dehydrogenase-like predicted oxidoreductase
MQFVTANGAKIPSLGFGTYSMRRGDMLRTIPAALKPGFRHIDTAQIYQNESEVGECVAASGPLVGGRTRSRLTEALGALQSDLTAGDLSHLSSLVPQGSAAGAAFSTRQRRADE